MEPTLQIGGAVHILLEAKVTKTKLSSNGSNSKLIVRTAQNNFTFQNDY